MTQGKSVQLSKYLSFLLRHGGEEAGLTFDSQGFTSYQEVWELIQKRFGSRFTLADFDAVIAGEGQDKKRFERQGEGLRAAYGHSRVSTVHYDEAIPPATLYHGTTPRALASIRQEGLRSMNRQYVHLTIDLERARSVARRYDKNPIILIVHAADAHAKGIRFYRPDQEHFLSDDIPPEFLEETDL